MAKAIFIPVSSVLSLATPLFFAIAIFSITAVGLAQAEEKTEVKKEPRCYMWGYSVATNTSDGANFRTLGNQIRLHFDAEDKNKCLRFIKSYCQYNILDRRDEPKKMKAYFRNGNEDKPSTYFKIGSGCEIEEVPEAEAQDDE